MATLLAVAIVLTVVVIGFLAPLVFSKSLEFAPVGRFLLVAAFVVTCISGILIGLIMAWSDIL